MNINLDISIQGLLDKASVPLDASVSDNLMLSPFYASIRDVEQFFPEEVVFTDDFSKKLSEEIFNSSIYIDNYIKSKRMNLSEEDLYYIKRQYVICAAASYSANRIYANSLSSSKVRKELGDFVVERSVTYADSTIANAGKDAKQCMAEILAEIDSMASIIAEGFVKGSNLASNKSSWRIWHHPDIQSRVPIAADKVRDNTGVYYKTGVAHAHKYISV